MEKGKEEGREGGRRGRRRRRKRRKEARGGRREEGGEGGKKVGSFLKKLEAIALHSIHTLKELVKLKPEASREAMVLETE